MVSYHTLLSAAIVGEGDEELAAGVGVEGVINVAFDLLLIPDSRLLSLGVDLRDKLVERRTFVKALPERLSVLGVITTSIELFSTVIGEGDTTRSQGKDLSLL